LVLTRQKEDLEPGPADLKGAPPDHRRARFRRLGGMVWVRVTTPNPPRSLEERPAWGLLDTGCEPVAVLTPRYLRALKSERGKGPLALPIRTSLGGAAREHGAASVMKVLPQFRFDMLGCTVTADGALSAASIAAICKMVETELDVVVGWPAIRECFRSVEIDYERCVLTVEPRKPRPR
jgi:hypothetical protein